MPTPSLPARRCAEGRWATCSRRPPTASWSRPCVASRRGGPNSTPARAPRPRRARDGKAPARDRPARPPFDGEPAARQLRTLAHAQEPIPAARRAGGEADAVVGDMDLKRPGLLTHRDLDPAGARVLADVGE